MHKLFKMVSIYMLLTALTISKKGYGCKMYINRKIKYTMVHSTPSLGI